MSRFPAAFRPPAFASRSPCSRPGAGPSSRSAYRAPPSAGPGRGFHVSHLRDTTGMGALSTPGTAVLSPAGCRARPAPAASQRPVPAPRSRIPPAGPLITRHQRGFTRFTRPVCPWPAASRWDGRPSGFPLCSAPRRYRQRTTGRGRAVSTRPELRDRHNRPSYPRVPSRGATSCRNGRCVRSRRRVAMHNHAARPAARRWNPGLRHRLPTRRRPLVPAQVAARMYRSGSSGQVSVGRTELTAMGVAEGWSD